MFIHANALRSIPESIGELKELRILDAAVNPLERLPQSLNKLSKLEFLYASKCALQFERNVFEAPAGMRYLNFCENAIPVIEFEFENAQGLEELMLKGNQLSQAPASVSQCTE